MRCLSVLPVTLLAVVAFASASTPTLRVPARVVPVYEETATPGMPSNYYPLCADEDNSAFALELDATSTECAVKTSYDWIGSLLPTAAERRELCSCTMLINQLQDIRIPRCSLYRSGQLISYADLIRYAFGLCTVGGGSSTTTSPTTTSKPTPTSATDIGSCTFPPSATSSPYTSATTPKPSTTSAAIFSGDFDIGTDAKTKKSKSKAPLIGGLLGGLAACAIIVFAVLQWRKKRSEDDDTSDAADVSSSDLKVMALEPLSPLDNSTKLTFPYVAEDLTPKASSSTTGSTTGKTF